MKIFRRDKGLKAIKYSEVKQSIKVDPSTSEKLQEKLATMQLVYSLVGSLIGAGSMVAGVLLLVNEVQGNSSFVADIVGSSVELSDATPGVILFVVGLLIIVVTKFSFSHVKNKEV
ncbi:hypothetical protein AB4238_20510 [Shewanella sp. 10N.286.45.A1]|uniref:hypothetical protein n=1 Tax=Shewanella sp. 10N.286.45.A1 TaxID=3229694 RepID=UPI00354F6357